MTRDFARSTRKSGKEKASASRKSSAPQTSPPWAWFLTGMLCGVFLSGLVWLAFQQPESPAPAAADGESADGTRRPEPRFDFYTVLPEQQIEIDMDPDSMATAAPETARDQYLLQAGSFKKPEDADRRRAELLLLGLDAHVEEARGDNGRWFRVYIGPFESRSKLAQARGLTAQQGIDTLLLKRPAEPRG